MLRLSAAGESPGPRAAAPWPLAGESRVTESPARADSDPGPGWPRRRPRAGALHSSCSSDCGTHWQADDAAAAWFKLPPDSDGHGHRR